MKMYRESYVVALMVNGKVQKELSDGVILLPFGSEYVIRLKNKLRKRSIADVYIDGKIAAKGIVVDANGTVDLERFVEDGNLSEGKRFKLVRINDPKVEQPDDSEVGSIEVNFYPEKDEPVIEKTIIHDYTYKHYCNHFHTGHCSSCCLGCSICRPWVPHTTPIWLGTSTASNTNIIGGLTTNGLSSDNTLSVNLNASTTNLTEWSNKSLSASSQVPLDSTLNAVPTNLGEAAATVQGSTSLQKFSSIYVDVDRSKPVTIRLIVKGISKVIDTCTCGFKRKKEKYCPHCGTQLVA